MSNNTSIIPKQKKGSKSGATAKIKTRSREEAQCLFERSCERLQDINNWQKISAGSGAEFMLTDNEGNELNLKVPVVGNLIRIKLPAPGNSEGDGYDWVRIEAFEKSQKKYRISSVMASG